MLPAACLFGEAATARRRAARAPALSRCETPVLGDELSLTHTRTRTVGGAAWEATAIRPRHGAKMSGSVIPCTFDIKQLQNDLNNAVADTQAKLDVPATRFYSLLFVEEGQARANVSITAAQCAVLRTALRPIFYDILKNGPYAKPHIMLDLLMRSDAVRSFTESPRQ